MNGWTPDRRAICKGLCSVGFLGLLPDCAHSQAEIAPIKVCGELHPTEEDLLVAEEILAKENEGLVSLTGQEAAALRVDMKWGRWNPNRISESRPLQVAFMQEDHPVNEIVIDAAKEWERWMRLRFKFVGTYRGIKKTPNLDILITQDSVGNNSALGVASRFKASRGIPSLHLQKFNGHSRKQMFGVALHELGHALGLIHEHQNPSARLSFDEDFVFQYYWDAYKWDKAKTHRNVLSRYGTSGEYAIDTRTVFDSTSIMLYEFPKEAFSEKHNGFSKNFTLSRNDKLVINAIYG